MSITKRLQLRLQKLVKMEPRKHGGVRFEKRMISIWNVSSYYEQMKENFPGSDTRNPT